MNSSRLLLLSPLLVLTILALVTILSNQVNWTLQDFCIICALLCALTVTIRFIKRFLPNRKKWAYIIFTVALFFILWGELGVGIFESPIAGD